MRRETFMDRLAKFLGVSLTRISQSKRGNGSLRGFWLAPSVDSSFQGFIRLKDARRWVTNNP